MKLTITTIAAIMIAGFASAQTIIIDGCAATKVEGANYYNFDVPGCKTKDKQHSSSRAEDKRREQAEKAE